MRVLALIVVLVGLVGLSGVASDLEMIDQTKQHETMAALCSISAAIELYSVDHSHYPRAGTVAKLEPHLVPLYTRAIPARDGWGTTFEIDSVTTSYTIGSCGKGVVGRCSLVIAGVGGEFTDPTFDIIVTDGELVTWPKGMRDAHVDERGRCKISDETW